MKDSSGARGLESDRRYRFQVAPEEFWSAIGATESYQRWWPWLRAFEARGLVAGDVWRCAVRPPLRYTVRFSVHLDEVQRPTLIAAHVEGDIVGTARLAVTPCDDGCDVRLTSKLAPSQRALAVVTSFARPLVRRGHDWVLDTGARQFADRALAADDMRFCPSGSARSGRR